MTEASSGPPGTSAPPVDPVSLMRSKSYRALLVLAALVGVFISLTSWAFLEAVYWIQHEVFKNLPSDLGFSSVPWWWPLPVLAIAGLLVAVAVLRLPGGGGHIPYEGLKSGTTLPVALPGILLAALASLGLGVVLGPEAPLIALGSGLAMFAVKLVKKDIPDQALAVLAAAGAFAALATIFGSPVVGAVILLEATGLGGPMLPVILLPGLMSAGIGSLVFIGMSNWTGLSTSRYALTPFSLPAFPSPTLADFAWTIGLSVVVALGTAAVIELARRSAEVVNLKPWMLMPVAGMAIAVTAIVFGQVTDQSADVVLGSGQDAFGGLIGDASTISISTLVLLLVLKGVAWGVSLGSFRGGPTFPALFMGAAAGLLAAHLPGYSLTPAVAALMGACAVSILKLPLSCIIIALILTSGAGVAVGPIVIVAVVVAYITTLSVSAARGSVASKRPVAGPAAASPA